MADRLVHTQATSTPTRTAALRLAEAPSVEVAVGDIVGVGLIVEVAVGEMVGVGLIVGVAVGDIVGVG